MIFNRVYSLEFGRPLNKTNAFPFKEGEVSRGQGRSLLITDLRVRFSAKKSGTAQLNEYTIMVDNLSQDKLDWISSFRSEEVFCKIPSRLC